MREHGYNVGGEASGHIILSDYATTGDGLVAALQVLAVVKKQDKPVSQVCHRFEPLPQILRNVRYKKGKPLEDAKVRLAIKSAEQKLNGQGRLVIRPSGTEPVIRVMGEGDDKTPGRGRGRRHRRGADRRRRLSRIGPGRADAASHFRKSHRRRIGDGGRHGAVPAAPACARSHVNPFVNRALTARGNGDREA